MCDTVARPCAIESTGAQENLQMKKVSANTSRHNLLHNTVIQPYRKERDGMTFGANNSYPPTVWSFEGNIKMLKQSLPAYRGPYLLANTS